MPKTPRTPKVLPRVKWLDEELELLRELLRTAPGLPPSDLLTPFNERAKDYFARHGQTYKLRAITSFAPKVRSLRREIQPDGNGMCNAHSTGPVLTEGRRFHGGRTVGGACGNSAHSALGRRFGIISNFSFH